MRATNRTAVLPNSVGGAKVKNGSLTATDFKAGQLPQGRRATRVRRHAGDAGGRSVWWSWTAARGGVVSFDTCGAEFDTLLAVYTGDRVDALTKVASNDDLPTARPPDLPYFCDNGR
jgi:hypothetical protein